MDPGDPIREQPTHLAVGRIVGTHGLKGAVRVALLSDFPAAFRKRKQLLLGDAMRPVEVLRASVTRAHAILFLEGVATIEAASRLRGELLYVPVAAAVRPRHGEHFWHQVIGLAVETEGGDRLGTVREILETGANDVYVVQTPSGEVLIPAIADVVQRLDVRGGRLVVRLLPGLLPGEDG